MLIIVIIGCYSGVDANKLRDVMVLMNDDNANCCIILFKYHICCNHCLNIIIVVQTGFETIGGKFP